MPITSTPYTAVYGPLSLPGISCTLWLDGADTTQVVFSSGSNVNTWKDKSGFGNSCSNITAGTSITYPGTIVNGLNTVGFTGGCIRGAFNGASVNTGTNVTVFMVAAKGGTGVSTTRTFALSDASYIDDSASTFLIYGPGTTNTTYYRAGVQPAGYTITANTPFLYTVTQTSGSGAQYFNGGSVQTDAITTSSFAVTNYNIGTTRFSNSQNYYGPVSEVIVYNAFLGDTQRQAMEGYLAQKWGLTANLPPGHLGLTQTFYNSKVYQSRIPLSPQPIYQNFNPKNLKGAACQLWLDGADPAGTGVAPANGSTVSTWYDKSGNGRNAPANTTGGTFNRNALNGNGGMSFTTTGTYLGQYYITPSFVASSTNSPTVFLVCQQTRYDTAYLGGNAAPLVAAGPYQRFTLYTRTSVGSNANLLLNMYNGYGADTFPAGVPISSPTIIAAVGTGSPSYNATTYGNGVSINPFSGDASYPMSDSVAYYVGSTPGNFIGNIYEVIFYDTALTDSQRQQVEGYLAWKWGLQNSLVNHPYKNVPPGLPWESSVTSGLTRLPPIVATGGTITFSGNFKIHTFTTVGTTNFSVSAVNDGVSVQVLVVGGGGGGAVNCAGGGGAGGAIFVTSQTVKTGSYSIVVGAGGSGGINLGAPLYGARGSNGGNSTCLGLTGIGGGGGGYSPQSGQDVKNGLAGGCGGGGAASAAGGSPLQSGGFAGGNAAFGDVGGGGGGGMGSVGSNGSGNIAGSGGNGATYTIGGTAYTLAGGGGGGSAGGSSTSSGGSGGGGAGAQVTNTSGGDATYYGSGGGGGAGGGGAPKGGDGYQGIVIIAYNYL